MVMSLLEWDDSYITGIGAADHEHQSLVRIINRAHDGWEREPNHDPMRLFDDIFSILLTHFDAEEQMMRQCRYAGWPTHARDHERVLEDLRGILGHLAEGSSQLNHALTCCLQPWLVDHIRVHDVPLYRATEAATVRPVDGP
jgi:hemerythrin